MNSIRQSGLKETVEEAFLYYTQQAGSINRQLGFAAIAVIWVLRAEGSLQIKEEFHFPLKLIVSSLAMDVLQYVFGSLFWGVGFRNNEGTKSILECPKRLWFLVALLGMKLLLMMSALVILLLRLKGIMLVTSQ